MSSLIRRIAKRIDDKADPKPKPLTKGQHFRHILYNENRNGRTFEYHATKGWRNYKSKQEPIMKF